MGDSLYPGKQRPSNTPLSLNPVVFQALSSADFLCQVGAVIWHEKSRRFLLYSRKEGRDGFPARSAESDLASLVLNPLNFVARETGYSITRLPLCEYDRRFRSPRSGKFHPIAVASHEVSTDPFKVTVETVWAPDQQQSSWGQPRQFVTFWFAGIVVDENPPAIQPDPSASHVCRLIHIDEAFKIFLDQGIDGDVSCEVLRAFIGQWKDTYPYQLKQ